MPAAPRGNPPFAMVFSFVCWYYCLFYLLCCYILICDIINITIAQAANLTVSCTNISYRDILSIQQIYQPLIQRWKNTFWIPICLGAGLIYFPKFRKITFSNPYNSIRFGSYGRAVKNKNIRAEIALVFLFGNPKYRSYPVKCTPAYSKNSVKACFVFLLMRTLIEKLNPSFNCSVYNKKKNLPIFVTVTFPNIIHKFLFCRNTVRPKRIARFCLI